MILYDKDGVAITHAYAVVNSDGKTSGPLFLSADRARRHRGAYHETRFYTVDRVPITITMGEDR